MLSQKPNHNKIALQFKDPPPEYGIIQIGGGKDQK